MEYGKKAADDVAILDAEGFAEGCGKGEGGAAEFGECESSACGGVDEGGLNLGKVDLGELGEDEGDGRERRGGGCVVGL